MVAQNCEFEQIIDDYQFGYPTIIEGEGAYPPEDVGKFQVMKSFFVAGMILSIPNMKKFFNVEKNSIIDRLTLILEIICLRLA